MKELILVGCSLSIVFIAFATWSCVVIGARSERDYIGK
ncbi:MAG: hypothetical protein NSGCLCUN01_03164 [uncultured Clostridium sp.]